MCMQFRKPARLQRRLDSQVVCLALASSLACLTIERDAAGQLARKIHAKIDAKIDQKSFPGMAPGHPKSTQNRSREPLGTPHGAQEHPGGDSGASWEHLGTSPARPGSARRVPNGAAGRQKGRPGASGSAPRRPKSTPGRVRERKNRVFVARLVRAASAERFFDNFHRFSVFS